MISPIATRGLRKQMSRCAGTEQWVPREALHSRDYDGQKSDVYAILKVMSCMIFGSDALGYDFESDQYDMPSIALESTDYSPELLEMLRGGLRVDEALRWNSSQLRKCKWLQLESNALSPSYALPNLVGNVRSTLSRAVIKATEWHVLDLSGQECNDGCWCYK